MGLEEHSDFGEEQQYLKYTVSLTKETMLDSLSSKKRIRGETRQAFMNYDYRESSAEYDEIMRYARQFSRTIKDINRIKYAIGKPYFARIDYRDDNSKELEKLYLGKMGIFDEADKPVVIDWRAPISSIYYEGRLGKVQYNSLDGIETGQMSLKRQYLIENSELLDIMDVDITTTDTFLQAALGESKDNRLKDIVSTIQAEQNLIIREEISSPLIVQGVAGSGKTTIALHRIAYLIYTYEKTFDPSEFLILAPSRLFLNYISEVLPELGAEQVKQSTFIGLSKELLGLDIHVKSSDEKLSDFIENKELSDIQKKRIVKASVFKGSLGFKTILEKYCRHIRDNFVPEGDFELGGKIIVKRSEILKLFLITLDYMPIYKRKNEIAKIIKAKLKDAAPEIIDRTEAFYDEQISLNRRTIKDEWELRQKNTVLIDERDEKLAYLRRKVKTCVNDYMKAYPKTSSLDYYMELMKDTDLLLSFAGGEKYRAGIELVQEESAKVLKRKTVDIDDLAAILFLHKNLYGFASDIYKYIVIDEAQDFNLFQLWILREIFNTNRFTLVGDLTQGIYIGSSYSNWNDVAENVFTGKKAKYLTLEQSYRTTVEIMNFANCFVRLIKNENLVEAKPVVRHGDMPIIFTEKDENECIDEIIAQTEAFKAEGFNSVAVITKTGKSCDMLFQKLKKSKKCSFEKLSTEGDLKRDSVYIVPAYMAKGLEFDAVIIAQIYESFEFSTQDLKLLYVSSTRALHKLSIVTTGGLEEILDRVDSGAYECIS